MRSASHFRRVEREPADDLHQAVASTAAIRQHPLHPMLVPLPIAAIVGLLGTDIAWWLTLDPFWARAGLWLAGFAAVTGTVAAGAGAIDFMTTDKVSRLATGWVHAGGNLVVLFLVIVSWFMRSSDPSAFILPAGLLLSAALVVLLGITGWAGGELSYRYRVGVIPQPHERAQGSGQ